MTSATPRTFLYQSAKRVLDMLQSGHNPTFEQIDKLSAAIQEYENNDDRPEAALSQAQQALRELCDAVNYEVDLNLSAKIKKAMKRVRAALPSDTQGAQ